MFSRLLILLLAVSCSTSKPTPYQKEKKKEGYRDLTFEELRVSSFKANAHTKKDRAILYAEFRAIDQCLVEGKKHANLIDVLDKTVEKEITKSTGGAWGPSIYGGAYPYYSRYSTIGVGIDYSSISTNSWKETLTFPYIEIYYTCADRVFRPRVQFKELTAEEIKHLVKDVKGALQIEKIMENSPNREYFGPGDIVLKANGKRIEKVFELISLFNADKTEVNLDILREGERKLLTLKSVDITSEVEQAEAEIIKKACQDKKIKKYNEKTELLKNRLCKMK